MLKTVASPPVVGDGVWQHSVAWAGDVEPGALTRSLDIELPRELCRAVAKRQVEFLAGRFCAACALRAAGCASVAVGLGADRAPLWPDGFVGSITHTDGFASAAVARATVLRGIGIDAERIMAARTAASIHRLVFGDGTGGARTAGRGCPEGLSEEEWTTLVFSAKESLCKCLFPLTRQRLELRDAEVVACDFGAGTVTLRLAAGVRPHFAHRGFFTARWRLAPPCLYTAVELRPVAS